MLGWPRYPQGDALTDEDEPVTPARGWESRFDLFVDAIRIGVPAGFVIWAIIYWVRRLFLV